ncbi:hypothetical protein D3C85_1177270 [compost metagenome]
MDDLRQLRPQRGPVPGSLLSVQVGTHCHRGLRQLLVGHRNHNLHPSGRLHHGYLTAQREQPGGLSQRLQPAPGQGQGRQGLGAVGPGPALPGRVDRHRDRPLRHEHPCTHAERVRAERQLGQHPGWRGGARGAVHQPDPAAPEPAVRRHLHQRFLGIPGEHPAVRPQRCHHAGQLVGRR